jgi:integrase
MPTVATFTVRLFQNGCYPIAIQLSRDPPAVPTPAPISILPPWFGWLLNLTEYWLRLNLQSRAGLPARLTERQERSMAIYQRGQFLRYRFRFAGKQIDESTKTTSKTIAREAERQHRRALEAGYNNFKELRENRVRVLQEIIDEYLVGYRLRYRSATFAEYALGHVARLLGAKLVGDITDSSVLRYQEDRLREKAAPKSINEEVRFLLKMLGDPGELIRAQLKKTKQLKLTVHKRIGKAFDSEESEKLAGKTRKSRSPHMYPAFMLARNGGLRDTEIKTLTWGQINFDHRTVKVGRAKSEAGEGRVVPLNLEVYQALVEHRAWYRKRFGEIREEWYVFPWGRPMPSDPTRHITSFKTAWKTARKNAKVTGRWHDNRHTLITELAESGAGDETIMEIAGHVDRQMLRHYSHIRMKAKREALEAVAVRRRSASGLGTPSQQDASPSQ